MPHIVFYAPCIPGNTGAAIRTSAATGFPLHLIEPLGFDLSESRLKRAGLDYHDLATTTVHPNLEHLLDQFPNSRLFAFTTGANVVYTDVEYADDDLLMFGPEPDGLPDDVLAHPRITERLIIPMLPGRRSLNLSNCAAIVSYEAVRQLGLG